MRRFVRDAEVARESDLAALDAGPLRIARQQLHQACGALEMVGMVTRQSLADLPAGLLRGDRVAVYLPMGYMIGGYTVFVPREWVTPIDMSVEEAMRQSLIAWMALGRNAPTPDNGNPP